jgi:myo-inositol-1(or 4)-monophosphatase
LPGGVSAIEPKTGTMQLDPILAVALAAARDAVSVHRRHLGRVARDAWDTKGVADFVTHVDREAEAAIIDRIRATFPDHAILAEESASAPAGGTAVAEGAPLWVIDPLDGTTNYLHCYPAYAVSIGVLIGGEPAVGVVLSGSSGEAWHAVRGDGAFHNGRRITVSGIESLSQALIGTGFPFKAQHLLPEYTRQFTHVLRRSAGVRRAGSAALDLCHLANGWFDGFWELSLAPWDVAAGTLIVREAGGLVTRLDGSLEVVGHGSILAGNPAIHEALGHALAAANRSANERH